MFWLSRSSKQPVRDSAHPRDVMVAVDSAQDGRGWDWPPSAREQDVIRLVLEGYSNGEIAFRLRISGKTVEFHLTNLYRRYHVHGRVSLAVMAMNRHWT